MKKMVKGLSLVLVCSLVAGITVPVSAAKKMKLSSKKITLKVGQKKKLEVKNTAKKVKWSIKSGKKYISLTGKKKTSVVVKAKKQGKAVVLAKIGNKKLTCQVTIKKADTKKPNVPTTTPAATVTPAVPTSTPASTLTPAPSVSPTETPVATPEATETPEPEEPLEPGEFRYEGLDRAWIEENIDPSKPIVAMTFDDGPGSNGSTFVDYGLRIQQALKDVGAHATFFYIGGNIVKSEECRQEVQQALDWGFEIANHSYDYASLDKATAEQIIEKLEKTDAILKEMSGYSSFLFRAPNVAYGDTMFEVIDAPIIDVSNWSHDYKPEVTKEQIVANVKKARDGDIINMHSAYEKTADAVPEILAYFQEKGIQVVSVSELFAIRGKKLMKGIKYFRVD
ncbi:MAG: polysaccharide deacetylase family protein [Eubacterium sp.]|nr:polysaccharide deacetylase family protein [Eubacterium sp.]